MILKIPREIISNYDYFITHPYDIGPYVIFRFDGNFPFHNCYLLGAWILDIIAQR